MKRTTENGLCCMWLICCTPAANGMAAKRTAAKEMLRNGRLRRGLRRMACCEEDHCEWTLLHVAHSLYSCCEGPAAKSMAAKRTAAKEMLRTDYGEWPAAKGLRRTDYGEWPAAKGTAANGLSCTWLICRTHYCGMGPCAPAKLLAFPGAAMESTKRYEGTRR